MNFIEKMLIRKISGVNESISRINENSVKELVSEMAGC
jgi:hypothetical protein